MYLTFKRTSVLLFVATLLFVLSSTLSAQNIPSNSYRPSIPTKATTSSNCCQQPNGNCVIAGTSTPCPNSTNCRPCSSQRYNQSINPWGHVSEGVDCSDCDKPLLSKKGQVVIEKTLKLGAVQLKAGQYGIGIEGNFEPIRGNTFNLGSSRSPFKAVYTKTLIAQQVSKSSDRRLKTNITKLPYGLQTVLQLKPSIYHYKNNTEGKQELGLIAQDLQETVPEVVVEGEEFLSVDYTALVPVLIQAIQEQQAIIEAQKSTIEVQQTAMEQTQSELKDLKANLTEVMDFLQLKEEKVGDINE
ncbi:MAG: tail fiber domain-containing protein [Chitinophagales bacterium]